MEFTCKKCTSRFVLPDAMLPATAVELRCTSCGAPILVGRPEALRAAEEQAGGALLDAIGGAGSGTGEPSAETLSSLDDAVDELEALIGDGAPVAAPEDEDDDDEDEDDEDDGHATVMLQNIDLSALDALDLPGDEAAAPPPPVPGVPVPAAAPAPAAPAPAAPAVRLGSGTAAPAPRQPAPAVRPPVAAPPTRPAPPVKPAAKAPGIAPLAGLKEMRRPTPPPLPTPGEAPGEQSTMAATSAKLRKATGALVGRISATPAAEEQPATPPQPLAPPAQELEAALQLTPEEEAELLGAGGAGLPAEGEPEPGFEDEFAPAAASDLEPAAEEQPFEEAGEAPAEEAGWSLEEAWSQEGEEVPDFAEAPPAEEAALAEGLEGWTEDAPAEELLPEPEDADQAISLPSVEATEEVPEELSEQEQQPPLELFADEEQAALLEAPADQGVEAELQAEFAEAYSSEEPAFEGEEAQAPDLPSGFGDEPGLEALPGDEEPTSWPADTGEDALPPPPPVTFGAPPPAPSPPPPPAAAPPLAPTFSKKPKAPAPPAPPAPAKAPPPAAASGTGKGKLILLIATVAVLVIAVGVVGFALWQSGAGAGKRAGISRAQQGTAEGSGEEAASGTATATGAEAASGEAVGSGTAEPEPPPPPPPPAEPVLVVAPSAKAPAAKAAEVKVTLDAVRAEGIEPIPVVQGKVEGLTDGKITLLATALKGAPAHLLMDGAVPFSLFSPVLLTAAEAKNGRNRVQLAALAKEGDAAFGVLPVDLLAVAQEAKIPLKIKVVAKAKKATGGLAKQVNAVNAQLDAQLEAIRACYGDNLTDAHRGKLETDVLVDDKGAVQEVKVTAGDEFGGQGATACVSALLKGLALPTPAPAAASEIKVNVAYRVELENADTAKPPLDVLLKINQADLAVVVGSEAPAVIADVPTGHDYNGLVAKLTQIYDGLPDNFRLVLVPAPETTAKELLLTLSAAYSLITDEGEAIYGDFVYLVGLDDPRVPPPSEKPAPAPAEPAPDAAAGSAAPAAAPGSAAPGSAEPAEGSAAAAGSAEPATAGSAKPEAAPGSAAPAADDDTE
ncbi:MAG: zinc-ribbon domain-containing protein [Myxococcota bacterium]|jgi:predicted Zn finger-like uncharacterized protein|nr:zinc-ribbon domain-containing protein [Myxococcota bacterium]